MREILLCARSPIRQPSLRRGSLLVPLSLLLVCFGLAPMAQAVGPSTDGAIPGSNNGEGILTATPIDGIGIASRYAGDRNIASDPAVIFADDFESYTLLSQLSPAAQATTNDPSKGEKRTLHGTTSYQSISSAHIFENFAPEFPENYQGSGKNQW